MIKTICDEYGVNSSDLRFFTPDYALYNSNQIRFKRRLDIKIPIPESIAPCKEAANPTFKLSRVRSTEVDTTDDNSQLRKLKVGLGEFELQLENKNIRFWIWIGGQDYYIIGGNSSYIVHKDDILALTFHIRRTQLSSKPAIEMPILPTEMLTEIYNNSVGFLLKGRDKQELYKKYRIPNKRGILLSGRAGCGKTMSCRWLRDLCARNNLAYRAISMEDYRAAIQNGRVRALFKLKRKKSGIIFFDDMDVMVKDRKKGGGMELSTFLSELDGLDPADGVVYIFTTNYIEELDEAFVRPGRIDLWLPFQLPSEKLRRKFIEQRFNEEIREHADTEDILKRTDNYSFAEMEEIRKLVCMDLIDGQEINIDKTFKVFNNHRKDFEERATMGFGALEDTEELYEDCSALPFLPPWATQMD
jgi:hypothetical protein